MKSQGGVHFRSSPNCQSSSAQISYNSRSIGKVVRVSLTSKCIQYIYQQKLLLVFFLAIGASIFSILQYHMHIYHKNDNVVRFFTLDQLQVRNTEILPRRKLLKPGSETTTFSKASKVSENKNNLIMDTISLSTDSKINPIE